MDGQYLQLASTTPTAKVQFLSTTDGSNATALVFNTGSLAISYSRDNGANVTITLVTATLGTWVSGGFIHRAAGVYDLYLPIAAAAAGAKSLTILATGLPAATVMLNVVIPFGADDVSAAAPTDASIAAATAPAVRTNLAVELARIDVAVSSVSGGGGGGGPSAATISTQVMTDLAGGGGTSARASIAAAVGAPSAATIATAVAAPSASTIAVTVETQLLDNFAALVTPPSASAIATAVDAQLLDNFAAIVTPPTASAISTQVLADLAAGPGVAARGAIADSFLARAIQGAADGGRTVRDAFRFLRNRVSRNVGTGLVTVMTEDDATPAWTTQTTSSTAAAPIINSDPT